MFVYMHSYMYISCISVMYIYFKYMCITTRIQIQRRGLAEKVGQKIWPNWLCYTSKNDQIWVPNFKIMIFNWSYLPEDYQINSWSSPGHDSACLDIPRSTQRVSIGLTVLFLIEFSNWNWWNRGVSISPIFWCHWVISP